MTATEDTMVTSPIWTGAGHSPDLTKTETGCHVWRGAPSVPCFEHGTVGCCLIMHASSAARRAFDIPRCNECGRWMRADRVYEEFCVNCEPVA